MTTTKHSRLNLKAEAAGITRSNPNDTQPILGQISGSGSVIAQSGSTRVQFATAPAAKHPHWTPHDGTWDDFVVWLDLDNPARVKACGGYVLAELRQTTVTHKNQAKQCTGYHRHKSAVVHRYALTLDADDAAADLPDRVERLGCGAVLHTTWRSTDDGLRLRVILALDRPVTPAEHSAVVRAVMAELGRDQFDPGSTQAERLMYKPSTQDPEHYRYWVFDGGLLEVDEWLSRGQSDEATTETLDPADGGEEVDPDAVAWLQDNPAYVQAVVDKALAKLEALYSLPKGVQDADGDRWDSGIYDAAKTLVRASNSGDVISRSDAQRAFMEHAPAAEDNYNPEHKWADAVKRVGDGVLRLPKDLGRPEDDFGPVEDDATYDKHQAVRDRYPVMDLVALLDPNRPKREWVVEGLIPAGTAVALVAPAGVGKSLFLLAMALEVARGRPEFAGLTIPQPRRVLIIDMENTLDDYAERLRAFGIDQDEVGQIVAEGRFLPINLPSLPPLDTAAGGEAISDIIRAYEIGLGDVVVLDSFQRVVEGPEDKSDTARDFYRHTGAVLKKLGVTVIRTDNTGKDPAKDSRGTSSKRDDVDLDLLMTPDGGTQDRARFRIELGKMRMAGLKPLTIVRERDSEGRLSYSSGGTEQTTLAREAVVELGLANVGMNKAWAAIQASPRWKDKITRKALRQALSDVKEELKEFVDPDEGVEAIP